MASSIYFLLHRKNDYKGTWSYNSVTKISCKISEHVSELHKMFPVVMVEVWNSGSVLYDVYLNSSVCCI